ncbi:putative transcriptional regulator of the myo-inositol catabolic operon [Indibacter alkaliphilus LW1]|jgi:LacI family transcriptional regulator|uniref:Transcriptional regulator of the myo-inositol catabolic operon n=1 Tax=Indibacter alkaliphilus (strain CCUG 57479 / KCTC 22604 / LW1) TaxID=1189612 RepID=S2DD52_INDAL|nr:LacI family DNA-binding transcriptional regulator [Indibacter alkaliphilus]EOZ97087.1 putative transcriptional regulator of the myo-inositol catabolic operon [Indibacter alkaliphilus LW1]
MKKGHQVTMKEIAKKLGVSVSTVSRALKDSPELHPDTKKRIVEMATSMNYQYNLLAQSLRISRSKVLGVIVPELTSHFFSSNISGIQDTAYKRGYNIMICQSNESFEQEKANLKTLVSSQVDGLLISLSRETKSYEHLQELYDREIPFIMFDRVTEEIPVSKVTVDDAHGAYLAVNHLLQQGCRKIAYFSGPTDLYISKKRKEGYLEALQEFGIPETESRVYVTDLTEEMNRKVTMEMLAEGDRPDAIFAMIDPLAIDVMIVLKENGIKIPQDIALAGFTNNPTSAVVEPSLTTISQPGYEMGQLAANHLLDQLDEIVPDDPQSFILLTTLVERNSSQKSTTA